MQIELKPTDRGFLRGEFTDLYGSQCSIQESSLADDDAIWLGVDVNFEGQKCTRMHLTIEMGEALLLLLQRFVGQGNLRGKGKQAKSTGTGDFWKNE